MKTKIFLSLLLAPVMAFAGVTYNENDLRLTNVNVVKNGQTVDISMNMDYTQFPIHNNQELIVTPELKSGSQSVQLPSVTFAGRNRYYFHKRNDDNVGILLRNGKKALMDYKTQVAYQPWMNNSQLVINYKLDGCCGETTAMFNTPVQGVSFTPPVFTAEYIYIPPKAERVKIRQETGTAFIDFVVNKTEINPTYRNNTRELGKITGTVNKIKDDKDITLKSMNIKGYASPEGSYENNVRLAKGRTEALEQYVQKLYQFPDGFITTEYNPANFEGLKAYLETSDVQDKGAIIDIIDSDMEPYPKNSKIRADFPTEYAWLLKNVYPSLRKSDYKVEYTVRSYTDVDEIIRVMKVAPQKLSLSEFYLAAQSLKPGTDDYNQVFDIAVKMFPNDEIANLNAANSAMQKGDFKSAGTYLKKAGNSNEAQYARALLAAQLQDYTTALSQFKKLSPSMPQAQDAVRQIEALQEFNGRK